MSFVKMIAPAIALVAIATTSAYARDQITLTGSSTVLPYATIVAEAFPENSKFKSPIVEGGGTGAGIAKFCAGVGEDTPDIANASRPIKGSERNLCRQNGVKDIMEVRIGYDGVVFASDRNGPDFAFTPSILFKALAEKVVVDGKLVPNPYTKWSQIDSSLPDQEILAFIPGSKHGTREVFDTKTIAKGCGMFGDKALIVAQYTKKEEKDVACNKTRQDGRVVEIDGDYTETLARLKANKNGVGVFGLSFYENNKDKLKVATFQGVTPTRETVATGKYNISRPLFMYVKMAHIGVIPGLKEFVQFFVSDDMAGEGGPLSAYGLVVDPKLADVQALAANPKKMP